MTTNTKLREALEALVNIQVLSRDSSSYKAVLNDARAALALTQHDEDGARPLWCDTCDADRSKEFCKLERGLCKFIGTALTAPPAEKAQPKLPSNQALSDKLPVLRPTPAEKASTESVWEKLTMSKFASKADYERAKNEQMRERMDAMPVADHAKRAGSEREQFEAWCATKGITDLAFYNGSYWGDATQYRWEAWQARGQQADKRADDLVRAALIEEVDGLSKQGDVLERAAQACDQQGDGTYGVYRTACLDCATLVRDLRDAARASAAKGGV